MRRVLFTIAFSLLLLLHYSCSSGISNEDDGTNMINEITAILEGYSTKTGIIENSSGGKDVVWKNGNAVSLFFGTGNSGGSKFTTTDNGPIATFSGTISAISGSLSGLGGNTYFWATYPYNNSASCDGSSITTVLESYQYAYANDVANDLLVTVGRSVNPSIYFRNTYTLIEFTLSQENISRITFRGNNNESVAGQFIASIDANNVVTSTPTENAVKSIVITPGSTTTFATGTKYYFAFLPGNFSKGYSLTFRKTDGSEATYTRSTPFSFAIGTFYTMYGKDSGLTFTPTIIPTDYIVFKDSKIKAKCVANWDTNGDGELSYEEAASVTTISDVFGAIKTYTSFDEFQWFTSVATVPNGLFKQCKDFTSIVLPESITSIGQEAFYGCSSLQSIIIPNSVRYIYSRAFYACSSLTSIDLPLGISYVADELFSECSSLENVTIGGASSLGEKSFYNCESLSTIDISNVRNLGKGVFSNCKSLTSVSIPSGVTVIPEMAFYGCIGLQSVSIPESVTIIKSEYVMSNWGYYVGCFEGCSNLTTINLPTGLTTISNRLFAGCSSLSSIIIPDNVTTIEAGAFSGCGLIAITLPSIVHTIGKGAFSNCTLLTSFTIPNKVSVIADNTFSGCSSLSGVLISDNVTTIGDYAFNLCTSLSSLDIPESVISVGKNSFSGCSSLTDIVIPESVSLIGEYAFSECDRLKYVTILGKVEAISSYCFYKCGVLKNIALPLSITTINQYAFSKCEGLVHIVLPNSVTSIGTYAFADDSKLSTITIPPNVETIDKAAFRNCSSLQSITILPTTPPTCYPYTTQQSNLDFQNTNNCPIYVPAGSVESYKTAISWSFWKNRIQAIPE